MKHLIQRIEILRNTPHTELEAPDIIDGVGKALVSLIAIGVLSGPAMMPNELNLRPSMIRSEPL